MTSFSITLRAFLFVAVLQLLMGKIMAQQCDPLKVAEAYIAEQFPQDVSPEMKPIMSEQETNWIISYQLPIYMLGGSPVITVDKRTCKVIDAYRTQ